MICPGNGVGLRLLSDPPEVENSKCHRNCIYYKLSIIFVIEASKIGEKKIVNCNYW